MTIKNEGIKKVNVKVSNFDDAKRVYDISAQVWITGNHELENVEDGKVVKDGVSVATFGRFSGNSHRTYVNLPEEEDAVVDAAIREFISKVRDFAANMNYDL